MKKMNLYLKFNYNKNFLNYLIKYFLIFNYFISIFYNIFSFKYLNNEFYFYY